MAGPLRHRVAALAVLVSAGAVWAQDVPRIGYVYPSGGCQGTVFEIDVGGQYLRGIKAAIISGGGIDAKVIRYVKPLSQQEMSELARKVRELRAMAQKRVADRMLGDPIGPSVDTASTFKAAALSLGLDLDLTSYTALRKRLSNPKRQPNDQIAEIARFYITIDEDAEPGRREFRVKTSRGISNPVFFEVGQCPETLEEEPNEKGKAHRLTQWLPLVVNGQIMPGDVDRFRFRATKGTKLVASVSARSLVPYLADAVPGWFQATLALYDADGREVAYTDDFRFDPDPVLCHEVTEDGEYILEIKDAIYRGREDFVYRIAIGGLPYITHIFPLGGRMGQDTPVTLKGWNLPDREIVVSAAEKKAPGKLPIRVERLGKLSNRVPFAVDTLPECFEATPGSGPGKAQPIERPTVINGRIDQPGDTDVFVFKAEAGEEIVAEVQARRLGSPVDSLLKLTDAAGALIAANDDWLDRRDGLTTHHADSRIQAKLPRAGEYRLEISETQDKGGESYAYRLRVDRPEPDFALRVVPSTVSASAGTIVPIEAFALRQDGFEGEVRLKLEGAPKGFLLSGGRIPPGKDKVRMTLTMPPRATRGPIRVAMEGRAEIGGEKVTRPAVPAEDMMQAFLYRHLVPTEAWVVWVTGGRRQGEPVRVIGEDVAKVPVGGTAKVRLAAPKGPLTGKIDLSLREPPEGLAIKEVVPDTFGLGIVLSADAEKAKPGSAGNLIITASTQRTYTRQDGTEQTRRVDLGPLPAIAYEIVADPQARATPAKP